MKPTSVILAACLALLLLFAGCWLSERGRSARVRQAYADTLMADREAHEALDALHASQRHADSLALDSLGRRARQARRTASATGEAVRVGLPSLPDTIRSLDSLAVSLLRDSLEVERARIALHLAADSAAEQVSDSLVASLWGRVSYWRDTALVDMRRQRDRVTEQLAGAIRQIRVGHSWKVDALGIAGALLVGRLSGAL